MHPLSLEQRLELLESALAHLYRYFGISVPSGNWVEAISGSLKAVDPEAFEEMVRLGREFRQADRPPDDVTGLTTEDWTV